MGLAAGQPWPSEMPQGGIESGSCATYTGDMAAPTPFPTNKFGPFLWDSLFLILACTERGRGTHSQEGKQVTEVRHTSKTRDRHATAKALPILAIEGNTLTKAQPPMGPSNR